MKKIIINGFPHSGTTILRKIIGSYSEVYDVIEECHDFNLKTAKKFAVCKFVGLPTRSYPSNVQRIMILKNPWDIFGSLYLRYGEKMRDIHGHQVRDYLNFVVAWTETKAIRVKYEQIVYSSFRYGLIKRLGIEPFERKTEGQVETEIEVPTEEPDRKDHHRFRVWQINQPIRNMTGESAVYCPKDIAKELNSYKIIKDIYNADFVTRDSSLYS